MSKNGAKHLNTTGLKAPWKPGQSGNPKGRPPVDISIANMARTVLEAKGPDGKEERQVILEKFMQMAKEGSVPHAQFIFERGYGKVKDVIENITPIDNTESKALEHLLDKNILFRQAFLVEIKNGNGTSS